TPRSDHVATRLADGRVLVVGGAGTEELSSAELFDPATATWAATSALTWVRRGADAITLADGRVLVADGALGFDPIPEIEIYDPSSGTWTRTAVPVPRIGHSTTELADGRVLLAGGADIYSEKAFDDAQLFDPKTGAWQVGAPMLRYHGLHVAALLADGR